MTELLNSLFIRVATFARREEGQTMAEYGIILALIAVVCIGLFTTLGTDIKGHLQTIVNGI